MARLNRRAASSDLEISHTSSSSGVHRHESTSTPASDIDSTAGSDKENRIGPNKQSNQPTRKRKSTSTLLPMSDQGERSTSGAAENGNKRRRTTQGQDSQPREKGLRRAAFQKELDGRVDKSHYDPDQSESEKRAVKKKLRNLTSQVNDNRSEFMRAGDTGIQDALTQADEIYRDVKQTSTATIDSRLLVTVGDLAYKKVNTLALGNTSAGIDVDDFVTKCISFMKRGREEAQPRSSQRRRNHTNGDEDEEDGEPMDWDYLGRNACFLYNSRPCLSGFLLGPLSLRKRVRQQTQRRAKEARTDQTQAIRPVELGQEDLDKQESANLTVICSEIARLLDDTIRTGEKRVEQEYEAMEQEPDEDEARALMHKHGLSDNACVPLFHFCVNPESFGQTVENMFYVSFLIKEGRVGLDFDSRGLPTLGTAEVRSVAERQETQRNQAVFTLDFDIWRDLVESFGIEKSIIPHRREEVWDDGTID